MSSGIQGPKLVFWKVLTVSLLIPCCLFFVAGRGAAQSAGAAIVISQVYGGGGNSGATLRNDFIELFNRSNQAITVTGWSVQYASASGTSWHRTVLNGVIQPGQYFLIQEAQGNAGSASLPTPDASGGINLSATDGKLALISNSTVLSGSTPSGSSVVDFVGYGTANAAEGLLPQFSAIQRRRSVSREGAVIRITTERILQRPHLRLETAIPHPICARQW